MKNKKIVYVKNKDDLVELLNNEVEKKPQNKRMPIILMILLSMAIIAAGYFGFRLWRYYQDYQDDQKQVEQVFLIFKPFLYVLKKLH